jgi:hypothetical protein
MPRGWRPGLITNCPPQPAARHRAGRAAAGEPSWNGKRGAKLARGAYRGSAVAAP